MDDNQDKNGWTPQGVLAVLAGIASVSLAIAGVLLAVSAVVGMFQ